MKILMQSYNLGLFSKKNLLPNIISGLIVGVVALPLALAFAIASGAKPEQGLYTAIVAGFLVSVFGGSRLQIAGPTGAFVVILSGVTAKYGIEGLQTATLLAGCLLFLMGFLKLGNVIKFIPYPVIVGFTAGIAFVIWVGQWHYFFGLPAPVGVHFHEKFISLISSFSELNLTSTLIGISSLLVVLYGNKITIFKRIPGPLLALAYATILFAIFKFDGVATIGSTFGGIQQGLPEFKLPNLNIDRIIELIGPAFAIAMLGAIESLLSAVIADGMTNTKHDSNQELVGQGIANIFAPMFGGFAATGAIARTATNIRNGGNSPLAGIVHSITLLLVILFLAPLAKDIPLAALSAILFVVAWNMSEFKHVVKLLKKAPRSDITILLVTLFFTIFVDLVVAVNVGVILAIANFMTGMSNSTEITSHSHDEISNELADGTDLSAISRDILVYSIDGPVFFGAVKNFESVLANTHNDPKVLIIRLRWVPLIDFTGLQALEEAILDLHKRGVHVILCGAKPKVERKLRKAGIIDLLGQNNFASELSNALIVSQTILNNTNQPLQT